MAEHLDPLTEGAAANGARIAADGDLDVDGAPLYDGPLTPAAVLVAILASYGIARTVTRPLGAVTAAMREMGEQFVLGRTIPEALRRGRSMSARGYLYSYDMLGEAARTEADALRYHRAAMDY